MAQRLELLRVGRQSLVARLALAVALALLAVATVELGLPAHAYGASDTSWTAQSSGESGEILASLSCASAMDCWAVGSWGTIVATTDGGLMWSPQSSAAGVDWLTGVSCPTASQCWAVTRNGDVEATKDGGSTWSDELTGTGSSSTSGTALALSGVSCPTASHCWAVGNLGQIIETSDGGTAWQPQGSGTTKDLYGVACVQGSMSTCWAVGAEGAILATTNGGTSWSSQTSGTNASLRAVSCSSASACVAVGDGGVIVTTRNGGSGWSVQSSGTTDDLLAASCPAGGGWCWVVGRDGTVLSGGPSAWTSESPVTTNTKDLFSVSCPTTAQCWASGDWHPSGQAVILSGSAPPVNSAPPTISGTAQAGQVLSAGDGSWDGAPPFSYGYQWQDCDSTGSTCSPIPVATGPTYTLTAADVGYTIRLTVAASNPAGTASPVTSSQTAEVAARPVWTGLAGQSFQGIEGALTPSQAAQLYLDEGAQVDRYTVTWWQAEPNQGVCESDPNNATDPKGCQLTQYYDPIYTALTGAQPGSAATTNAHPIRPVIVVAYAPSWAINRADEPTSEGVSTTPCGKQPNSQPCAQQCPTQPATYECAPTPDHYQDYANFAATVAKRYPLAAAIEVWNEENGGFAETAPCCDPNGYAQLLRDTYQTVHPLTQNGSVSSDMKVLLGGLVPTPPDKGSATVAQFLGDVYATWGTSHGTPVFMDGIGLHLEHNWPGDDSIDATLDEVRDVRDDFGDSLRQIYVTEAGTTTTPSSAEPDSGNTTPWLPAPGYNPPVDEAEQAIDTAHMWNSLSAQPDIGALLPYTDINTDDPTSSDQAGYGFLDNNDGTKAPGVTDSSPPGGTAAGWRGTPYRIKPAFCINAQLHSGTPYSDSYQCPAGVAVPSLTAEPASGNLQAQTDLQAAYEIAREYFEAHGGSFTGFTNQVLGSQRAYGSGLISGTAPVLPNDPGANADPSQIDIVQAAGQTLQICNSGTGDTSYCILRTQTDTYSVPDGCSKLTCSTIDATGATYQEAIEPTNSIDCKPSPTGDRCALGSSSSNEEPYGWAPWAPRIGY